MEVLMKTFESMWRQKIVTNTKLSTNHHIAEDIQTISVEDEVLYSKELISKLRQHTQDTTIAKIFCNSACHMPHNKLEEVKRVYQETQDIKRTRNALEDMFIVDIKQYKNLSDSQINDIISKGWGAAGLYKDGHIIATKIPSKFHEYFNETDQKMKKYYYCHCPRVRKELLNNSDLDSIYCNCGGGFYKDIWEYITGSEVSITVLKNLFDGDDVCQFRITI